MQLRMYCRSCGHKFCYKNSVIRGPEQLESYNVCHACSNYTYLARPDNKLDYVYIASFGLVYDFDLKTYTDECRFNLPCEIEMIEAIK